ncbi:MAG: hypothetical protein ACRDZ4_14165 [Egibacteraceae bacterium]
MHVKRFLSERERFLAAPPRVEFLNLQRGQGDNRSVKPSGTLGERMVAAALQVSLRELAPDTLTADEDSEEAPSVAALRAALTDQPWVVAMFTENGAPAQAPNVAELQAEVDEAWKLVHASSCSALERSAPSLLARADSPLLAVAGLFRMAHVFLGSRRLEQAQRGAAAARRGVREPGDAASPGGQSATRSA